MEHMATADFTIADVLAWARTKPADEGYCYTSSGHCALCQFLRETGRAEKPGVDPLTWTDLAKHSGRVEFPIPPALDDALAAHGQFRDRTVNRWTFGALVERLGRLCPETIVTPSQWARLDAYLTDIEQVPA
jgi:hypothetical protein